MRRLAAAAARRPTLCAAAVLLVVLVALFSELVFRGRVLFNRDIHFFWYTQVESFVNVVSRPAWPVWDPFTSFGQPLLADPSAQIFYPTTWLNLLVRPWTFYRLHVLGHLLLSGLGLFALARRLELRPAGATAASVLWVLSGPVLSLVANPPHFTGATWIPWILYGAERAFETPGLRTLTLWVTLLVLQIFAGSADMCALALLGVVVLALRRLDWRHPRTFVPLIGRGAAALALASGLTACLWAPALAVVLDSARRTLPEAVRTRWSVHPLTLPELLYPLSERVLPFDPALRTRLYDGPEPFLQSLYLGLPLLALALAAWGAGGPRGVRRVLAGLAVLALLIGLGRHTPVYGLLVTLCPPARLFRYPQKALVLLALASALLAGLGLEAWRRCQEGVRRPRWPWRVAALTAVGATVGWLGVAFLTLGADQAGPLLIGTALPSAYHRSVLAAAAGGLALSAGAATLVAMLSALRVRSSWANAGAALVVLVAAADLVVVHRPLNPTARREVLTFPPAALEHLRRQDHSRLFVFGYTGVEGQARRYLGRENPYLPQRVPPGWSLLETQALAYRQALVPPSAGAWGQESSFDLDYRGLYDLEHTLLVQRLLDSEETPAFLRLLRLGAVSRVVALHQRGLEALEPVAVVPGLQADPLRVFRVPAPLPRCYVVDGVRVARGAEAVETLVAEDFDPRREVVLPAGRPRAPVLPQAGVCHIEALRPDVVRLSVDAAGPGHVVLVDTFAPAWRATVDGHTTPVERANVAFRAVAVPAGEHRVELRCRPRGLREGLALSLMTLLGIVAAFGHAGWRRSGGETPAEGDSPTPR